MGHTDAGERVLQVPSKTLGQKLRLECSRASKEAVQAGWGKPTSEGGGRGRQRGKSGCYHGGGVLGTIIQTLGFWVFFSTLVTILHIRFLDLIDLELKVCTTFSKFTLFLAV